MASPLYVEGLKAARMGGFFVPFRTTFLSEKWNLEMLACCLKMMLLGG